MGRAASVALVLAFALAGAAPAWASAEAPAVVPALRAWKPAPGSFSFRQDVRIVVAPGDRAFLGGEARTLAADLAAVTGRSVRVAARARTGDVVLRRNGPSKALGAEGYRLQLGRVLTVTAPTTAGAFYGGRTVLQLRRLGSRVPRGAATDRPAYRERGLMIDAGRRFYPRSWLAARIRELGDLKLNMLHLHLSDTQGFRIASVRHPEAVTAPALSRADIAALVAVARRAHVTIVPEVDMPGHMTAALARHPELQLKDAQGTPEPDRLDVTLPAARRFAAGLVDELARWFPGRWWHAGADEYLGPFSTDADWARYPQLLAYAQRTHGPGANAKDAVLDFVRFIDDRVRRAGKHLRVWSDGVGGGATVALRRGTVVEWWDDIHSQPPAALVQAGYDVLNAGWWPTYYVTGGPLTAHRASEQDMFAGWSPWQFDGPLSSRFTGGPGDGFTLPPSSPALTGAALNVWNDDPTSPGSAPEAIAAGIAPRLRILSQKTWGTTSPAADAAAFGALAGRALGER